MDTQKQQVAQRVKEANNILVTVSNSPSVDQLAACIGLTLALNKAGKHATAVFSGDVPSTIEFLQPEKTLEKNTDSLRDFIIALDKSKADKLRYKVEDRVVKIFITPYKTSINDKDLEFSQGDFNVDVVLALGVHNQSELDQAITAHGRILHDATVVTINVKPGGELGSMNWLDPGASSLSELAVQLLDMLDKKLMDGQIATSMLTGIVAETERFSNAKTSPQTMSISAELMSFGANQQLVATKLEEPAPPPPPVSEPIAHQDAHEGEGQDVPPEAKKPDDGTLEISHDEKDAGESGQESAPEQEPAEDNDHPAESEEEPQPEAPKEEPAQAPVTSRIHDVKSNHDGMLPPPDEHHERHGHHPEDEHDEHDQDKEPQQAPEHSAVSRQEAETPDQELEPVVLAPAIPVPEPPVAPPPQIHIDEHGSLSPLAPQAAEPDAADEALLPPAKPQEPPTISHHNEPPKMVLEPPALGGQLSANAETDAFGASADDEDKAAGLPDMPQHEMPMLGNGQGLPGSAGAMNAGSGGAPSPATPPPLMPPTHPADETPQNAPGTSFLGDQPLESTPSQQPQAGKPPMPDAYETLSDIERDVHSSHVAALSADQSAAGPVASSPPAGPQIPVVHPDDLTPDEVTKAFAAGGGSTPADPTSQAQNPFDANAFSPVAPAAPDAAPATPQASAAENVSDARDAVAQAISGSATPPLDAIQASGNVGDTLVAQAAPGALPVSDPNPMPPQTPPPVQPWIPPTETEPSAALNPATQFNPAAFSQDDSSTPPASPPPIAPPHMPGM